MTVKVCIFHPADPAGTIPGGVDTFIKGILRWAPDDILLSLVGVTTDSVARPPGKWVECDLGRRKFNFYPVIALDDPGKRSRIPLSLRFSAALVSKRVSDHHDILEFHRIEPSLIFFFDERPKNAFIHQDMEVLFNEHADIVWKRAPWIFFKLEDWLLPRMQSVFVVRESAVTAYRRRYPAVADRFNFIPTWMDPDMFYPATQDNHKDLKARLGKIYGFELDDVLLISVGRLDQQKNPVLLLDAFDRVSKMFSKARLIMVGDGILHSAILGHIEKLGLKGRVILAGLRTAGEIADLLRISNVFVLSSAYEGMPMCVLESLGSGLPAAVTDVGEVRRVVKPGINGEIAEDHSPDALANAVMVCIRNYERYRGRPCLDAVTSYVPAKVLEPVYENYRILARRQ